MNISILYATYSNSTYTAAEVLKEALEEAGHEISVNLVHAATAQNLADADLTIFASPSWDFDGKEGQPHEDFFHFFAKLAENPPAPFSYTVLGLGDSNYTYFCGAVDEILSMATAAGGKQTHDVLKLDQYYLNEATCVAAIKAWALEVTKSTA
ncbi:MAG: flavodoxin domain-containing protein [bacterium]|nr:flavodoxin domain-containing protein [bacterium]